MTFSDVQTGGTGYLAYAVESTPGGAGAPGTAVTPNLFLPVVDKQFSAKWDQVQPKVMRNTRMTMAVSERARLKISGKIDWLLNPSLGLEFFTTTLGASASVSAVAAVATTAGITTSNGVSTITVAGTFTPGAWVYVNVSAGGATTSSTEVRQVLPQSTAGTLVVGQLTTNAAASTGIYVTQPAQTKYANSLLGAAYINQLPTLTCEDDYGNWAWRFAGCYVDTLDIDMSKDEMKVSAGVMGSADPIYEATGVTYAPTSADEKNALRPLTSIDGQIVAGGDPDDTGTSNLRAALGVSDIKIAFKNGLIETPVYNNSHTYLVNPGDTAECSIDFTELSTSKRPDAWTDYIKASQSVALCAGAVKDYSATTTPNFGAMGFYVPTMKFTDAEQQTKIGALNQWSKKGVALAPAGGSQDYLQLFQIKPS